MHALQALEAWQAEDANQEKSQAPRWRPEQIKTLSLYINPETSEPIRLLMRRACREWEAASGGLLQWVPTMRPEQADIRIEWTETPTRGREFEVGHTQRHVQSPCWIVQATITLLREPLIDTHLTPDQIQQRLYTTMLHELGHALGLEHSSHRKDVMYHQGWRNTMLSPNDSQRLQDLYAQPTAFFTWV